jgi:hypothetical protein
MADRWEYKLIEMNDKKKGLELEAELNRLGLEGWEVIHVDMLGEEYGQEGYSGRHFLAHLKRRKP